MCICTDPLVVLGLCVKCCLFVSVPSHHRDHDQRPYFSSLNRIVSYLFQMTSSLQSNEDPVSERKKLYISERQIPALFEVDIR